VHGRELRRAAARHEPRRRARLDDRPAADALDRHRRLARRPGLPAPLAGHDARRRSRGGASVTEPLDLFRGWVTTDELALASAAASRQSQPIRSREELEAAVAAQPKEPSRPPYWGCYRLVPESYEFWRHRENRLHERRLFTRGSDGWQETLLQP